MGKGWGSLGIWVRTVVRNNQKEKCYSARWAIRNTLVLTGSNVKHPGMGRSHGRTRNGRVSVEKHRKVSLVQESAFTEWSLHFTEDAQITTLQSILDNILHILTIWAFEAACFKIHVRESFIVAWLIYDQLRSAKLVQPSGSPACKTRQSVHYAHNPMALINFIILVFNLFLYFWLAVCLF